MLKITICPVCGSNKIKLVKRDWTRQYCGRSYTVLELEYYECPNCNERVYDRKAMQRIQAYSPAFAKKRRSKVPAPVVLPDPQPT